MKIRKYIGFFLYQLFRYLPTSFSPVKVGQKQLRGFATRLMLEACGKDVNIERNAVFSTRCTIGDRSGIGVNAVIGETHLGDNVMMGENCRIITQNHRFDDTEIPMNQQGFQEEKPVFIGNDVWIGYNVTILPGVTVGDGAVIGACSVVTRDVRDYDIVAGNPARTIRNRKEDRPHGPSEVEQEGTE